VAADLQQHVEMVDEAAPRHREGEAVILEAFDPGGIRTSGEPHEHRLHVGDAGHSGRRVVHAG
jgi:hypothetical protein